MSTNSVLLLSWKLRDGLIALIYACAGCTHPKTQTMQSRIVYPIAIASLAMGVAFGSLAILERNRVQRLVLATGSPQGQYHAFSQALSTVVSRHLPNLRLELVASNGSVENMSFIESRTADLALTQNDTPATASARAVAVLFPELLHIMAARDSGIETFADLQGRRIALMPQGSGSYALFWQLAQHYGLTPETLDHIALPPDEAYSAFLSGDVDALSRVIALGNSSTAAFLQENQSTLVSVDQVEALQIAQPFLTEQIFPQGAYGGNPSIPIQDTPAVAVQAVLMAHRNVNPQLIRDITRILNEHRSELIALHPGSAAIPVPTSSNNFGVPVHPGAEGYYTQDEPNFLVAYAEAIGLMVSVGVLIASGMWQVHQRLLQRQKNRADMYNLEILALLDRVYQAKTLNQLDELRFQLYDILKKVVEDLDLDRITPESFESFTFPWGVAIDAIRHRELLMERQLDSESPKSIDLINQFRS